MVLVLCINVLIINLPNTEKSNLTIIYQFFFFGGEGGGTFLESPDNFSGPEGCFMFAVYAVKIKVSIILKIIQWN